MGVCYLSGVVLHPPWSLWFRWALPLTAALALGACDGELDGVDCEAVCSLEEECGLRTFEECREASCIGDVRLPAASDACMQLALDCAEVAACTCSDACGKVEECTDSPDPSCVETCDGLVKQSPVSTYRENRCLIESSCDEIATCGGVGG